MTDKIVTDTQNQKLYLENLAKSGDTGQQEWAKNQLTNFDNNYSDARQAQPDTSMNDMMNMLGAMSGAYVQQQQGMLESTRQNQLANLQKAYSDAVSQGRMSIRDAEEQYTQQADSINQTAYQDAERTKLYGQNMGLSNSQQMAGLMQGDNARKNSLINQNITVRDKRINDIRDRINSITTQRDLDVTNVNAQYDAGLQQATGTAMMNMGNNAFGLMQNDYTANREHQRALELSDIEYERAKEKMNEEQRFALERIEKEHGYAVARARLSATLEAQMREAQAEKELLDLFDAYKIDRNDPEALYKLRMRQNNENMEAEAAAGIAYSQKPSFPEPIVGIKALQRFFNPSEFVTDYENINPITGMFGGVYQKSDIENYNKSMDALKRYRNILGVE